MKKRIIEITFICYFTLTLTVKCNHHEEHNNYYYGDNYRQEEIRN